MDYTYQIKSVLFGAAVGDALGVPVEFKSRQTISRSPVTDMTGYGVHNQPPGTFSDDASLTFCLAQALCHGFDVDEIAGNFVKWCYDGYWSATGSVFDIGIATRDALNRIANGTPPLLAGGSGETDNGNGSLMRIAPLLFYLLDKQPDERYERTRQVSSITHRHVRSVIACFYYLEFARWLLGGMDKFEVYKNLQTEIPAYLTALSGDDAIDTDEVQVFNRLLRQNIHEQHQDSINSTGYVLHTLEAAIWCLLTTDTYPDAVLKAVNLGDDTDTTGAVTGALAGLLYGYDNIPAHWVRQIARAGDIADLAGRLAGKIASGKN